MKWGNTSFQSSYDPVREAVRFIREVLEKEEPSCIILLGPGLGYLTRAIHQHLPRCRIICLYYTGEIFNKTASRPMASWHVGSSVSLDQFLRSNLSELDMEGLKVIEWPASAKLFPGESDLVTRSLGRFLREMRGNVVTTGSMGRLWIRNTIDNFVAIDQVAAVDSNVCTGLCFEDRPIVVAASGPSLEAAAPFLARLSHKVNLWALPSAVPFLMQNSVLPDLIVMTDPGYYSISHLHSLKEKPVFLAMPLSAARGIHKIADRVILLEQPNFFEEQLIREAGISALRVPALGTVAASSLELALQSTHREIIFLGLDLCYRDIQSHARPSLHDLLVQSESNRLSPHHSRIYENAALTAPLRGNGLRFPLALQTYQEWFARHALAERIYRFMPFSEKPELLQRINGKSLEKILDSYGQKPPVKAYNLHPDYPSFEQRRSIALDILQKWHQILQVQKKMLQEEGKWNILFQNNRSLAFSYFICLFDLLSLKRQARSASNKTASDKLASDKELVEQAVVIADTQLDFTESLLRRVTLLNQQHIDARSSGA